MKVRTICLHGPESTGKSTIAHRLAAHLDCELVEEYGREYAEARGTDFTMRDLLEIAKTHDAGVRTMLAAGLEPLVLDTDPLMTAVWADMLFGERDPWFDEWQGMADLYLLFDIDLPWVADGTRLFGSPDARQRFFDLSKAVLEQRGVRWALVSGTGEARWESVLRAIEG
ncbi:AAA family ATPase [Sphingomonas turrisvirgatae]|uniref:N-acetylglucosamine-6-phosphate isomerase n=1 Tax=Sphingomonas turrisvirgatae TaxID=1888892 RepID=A0A1E3LX44_9SPHN|nr:ATP-binding protein [Sphingomonas turrisvirgatae]ODP38316.1 N-acetylglucosamine-6-phosphate isomerase [Sphingomonas turrisvirgatae]